MTTLKHSRQRKAIKDFLMARRDHPTAEIIYTSLRLENPRLSLGTVYRNLSLLTQLGEIQKICTEDGPDHFDADTSVHHHFICRCCHQVSDIQAEGIETILEYTVNHFAGQIEGYELNFYGICENCRKKTDDSGITNVNRN